MTMYSIRATSSSGRSFATNVSCGGSITELQKHVLTMLVNEFVDPGHLVDLPTPTSGGPDWYKIPEYGHSGGLLKPGELPEPTSLSSVVTYGKQSLCITVSEVDFDLNTWASSWSIRVYRWEKIT